MKTGQGIWAITLLTTAFISFISTHGAENCTPPEASGAVYISNISASFDTNGAVIVRLDIAGDTNTWLYDVFGTTNLISNPQWIRVANGRTGDTVILNDQPGAGALYILGTPQDRDADGLTDARERLVTKTDPDRWDTDGDGLSDGDEVIVFRTDPHNQDTDGDGLVDQPFKVIITCPRCGASLP